MDPIQHPIDPDDDKSWEDVSEDELRYRARPPSSTPSTSLRSTGRTARTRIGARRRNAQPSTLSRKHVYSDFRGGRTEVSPPLLQETMENRGPGFGENVNHIFRHILDLSFPILQMMKTPFFDVLHYGLDVFRIVVRMMKTPICLFLFALACTYGLAFASEAIRSALAPLCSVPFVSLLCPASPPRGSPSRSRSNPDRTPRWADFPSLLNVETKSLETLLDEAVQGPGLALEIKKAEMATSDLTTLVRISSLNSRDVLAESLGEFVKDARKVGRGLTRFSSRVGGAVDNIIAVNDYALHAIESAYTKPGALLPRRMWPLARSEIATKQLVTQKFTEAMNTLSANMQRLVLEAEVSIADLNKLEEHLKSIHEVVSREDLSISTARAELLAQLWTILGGNKDQLNGMDERRTLLKGVSGYRDRALAHVVAALQTLEAMAEDMEELRERVAAPELVGDAIPIDVHLKSLKSGLERLKERRTGTKQLEEKIVNQILGSVDGVKVARG